MRNLIYGFIVGAAVVYGYTRLDPKSVFEYLAAATESAVESTYGYGGKHK